MMHSAISTAFFTLCLFLIGALSLGLPSGHSFGFYLICFVSLILWLPRREQLFEMRAKYFALPLLLYAGVHLSFSLFEELTIREVGTYLTFFWGLFGLWAIQKYKPKSEWFWMGLAVGAIAASVVAGYQFLILGQRARGFMLHIQFGNLALLLGVMCLIKALITPTFHRLTKLYWLGFFSGVAASIWSQTRGGWLAILLIFAWIFAVTTKNWSMRQKIILLIAVLIALVWLVIQPKSIVHARVRDAYMEVVAFLHTGQQDTAVGARLAMWSVAWDAIWQSPWFGIGQNGWVLARDAALADGRLSEFSARFTHVHNEYLDVAMKRGLIGLLFHLVLMLGPMLLFFAPHKYHASSEVRALAIAGMVVPMMYMDFGLTQTFLSHNSARVMFSALLMCLAGLMLNAIDQSRITTSGKGNEA